MDRFKNFLSSKGFYVALCVGIFAFAALMIAGEYRDSREKLGKEQTVDLNEPSKEMVKNDDREDNNEVRTVVDDDKKDIEGNEGEPVQEANSNDAIPQVKNEETQIMDNAAMEAEIQEMELVFDEERSLVWPVIGNVIIPYSMDTTVYFKTLDVYKCNPGMVIQAEEGAQVVSACKGIVTEIEDTKEFGTVIKVNLGSGYEATYGQLKNITVGKGDMINESQIIGEVAQASSYYENEGTNVYFSITKDDVPLDPVTLIQ